MASTDIDGSVIVILSEKEARRVYQYVLDIAANGTEHLTPLDRQIAHKIYRDLSLPPLE